MTMVHCSALATRHRTVSLNIDPFAHVQRLDDIIEEDNRFSSSVPRGRSRAHTVEGFEGSGLRTRHLSMSDKESLDNLLNRQRRVSPIIKSC